ncbi:MAG: BrnT family toxin [Deltaproteobacteria bacterium]
MLYKFEWDPTKAKRNFCDHQVSFERATTIFRDSTMIALFDEEHSQHEDRWITLGRDDNGILLVVSHTFREMTPTVWTVRMISARKATKKERMQYEEGHL